MILGPSSFFGANNSTPLIRYCSHVPILSEMWKKRWKFFLMTQVSQGNDWHWTRPTEAVTEKTSGIYGYSVQQRGISQETERGSELALKLEESGKVMSMFLAVNYAFKNTPALQLGVWSSVFFVHTLKKIKWIQLYCISLHIVFVKWIFIHDST